MIASDMMRLTFDVDDSYSQKDLDYYLQQEIGFVPRCSILKSDVSESYHIYYDLNLSVDYHRYIAERIKGHLPSIDTAIYRVGGSLRLPNCIKISDNQIVQKRYACASALVIRHLLSANEDYPTIYQPLHTMNKQIIDHFYKAELTYDSEDLQMITDYCNSTGIKHTLKE